MIGNATHAAELRSTTTGKSVASLRIATRRIVVYSERLAETVSRSVKKGDPLYVEDRPQYRVFQDEEGRGRGIAESVASDVQFLSRCPSVLAESANPSDVTPDS
jgi:single-stranded DNA-binding protein